MVETFPNIQFSASRHFLFYFICYYKWSKDGRIRTYTFTEQDYDWIVMMNNAGIYSDKNLVFEE